MKRIDYRHIICIAITVGFIALGVFKFFGAVGRLIECGRDIGLSAAFYFCELFQFPHSITPTVNDFPKIPFFDFGGSSAPSVPIPDDWQGFTVKWSEYWRVWASGENFFLYLAFLGDLLYTLSMLVLCLLPAVLAAYLLLKKFAKAENNDWGKDTKPLRVFKRISSVTYQPVKDWLGSFIAFVRDNGVYWKIWLCLWLFYFNVFTIVLEFIAFYLYFVVSFDFVNIYRQIYKLILDLNGTYTLFEKKVTNNFFCSASDFSSIIAFVLEITVFVEYFGFVTMCNAYIYRPVFVFCIAFFAKMFSVGVFAANYTS